MRLLKTKKNSSERLQDIRLMEIVPKYLPQILEALTNLQDHVLVLNKQVADLKELQNKQNRALLRRQLENLNQRSERRDLRAETLRLKDLLWKHIGREH